MYIKPGHSLIVFIIYLFTFLFCLGTVQRWKNKLFFSDVVQGSSDILIHGPQNYINLTFRNFKEDSIQNAASFNFVFGGMIEGNHSNT